MQSIATTDRLSNQAYAATFSALELIAASTRIELYGLHHRYQASTARRALRNEAARLMRSARATDRATTRKVWARHRPQI